MNRICWAVISLIWLSGCNRNESQTRTADTSTSPSAPSSEWTGRKILPTEVPKNWVVWTARSGFKVATPAPLLSLSMPEQLPGFDQSLYGVDHAGVRYQISLSSEKPESRADLLNVFFEAMFDNFAESSGLRREGTTERLMVDRHPVAQSRFTDGSRNAIVRAAYLENQSVVLAVLKRGAVIDSDPAIGGFLNSLSLTQ